MLLAGNYLSTPWEEELIEEARKATSSIFIVCPFIKLPVVKRLLAAIPNTDGIRLEVLTRFTKQVFNQGSSDLSVFDLLLGYASRTHHVTIHSVSSLHAKVYVFDGNRMYLTSSNLSYSGLNTNVEIAVRINELSEITEVCGHFRSLSETSDLVTAEMVLDMGCQLRSSKRELLAEGRISSLLSIERTEPAPAIESAVFSAVEEPRLDDLEPSQCIGEVRTLDEINSFLKERDVSPYSGIDGVPLASVAMPIVDRTALTAEEQAEFRRSWEDKAREDREIVHGHLSSVFGQLLEHDETRLNALETCFVERSWKNVYRPVELEDRRPDLFHELGSDFHTFMIARHLSTKRFFAEDEVGRYDAARSYMIQNYPYAAVLSDMNCRFLLTMGELPRTIDRSLFFRILGCFAATLPLAQTMDLYEGVFSRLDDFVYDNYWSFNYRDCLQEMVSREHGLPRYEVTNESGPDHDKSFEVTVLVGGHALARGTGRNKHEAAIAAAREGIVQASRTLGITPRPRPTWRYLRKYDLSAERQARMESVLTRLPGAVDNTRLVDVALTHPSAVNEQSNRRSYRRLAYLGAHLEEMLRRYIIYHSLGGEATSNAVKFAGAAHRISPIEQFSKWFDMNGLSDFVDRGKGLQSVPTSSKVEVVQALVAVTYTDAGVDAAVEFVSELWRGRFEGKKPEEFMSPVAKLQEYVQASERGRTAKIEYRLVQSPADDSDAWYEVACLVDGVEYGRGSGRRKADARNAAAAMALRREELTQQFPM